MLSRCSYHLLSALVFYARILFFFFNDTAPTEIYPLSLHDALPIWPGAHVLLRRPSVRVRPAHLVLARRRGRSDQQHDRQARSEEHTSELQSLRHLVCRLLLEKNNQLTQHA